MDEWALLTRSIHPRNLKAIDLLRRISERHIDGSSRESRIREHTPNGRSPPGSGICITHAVGSGLRFEEVKNPVLAWVQARHKRSPRWWSERRNRGSKRTGDALTDQFCQVAQQ